MALDSKYIRYDQESISKFKMEMRGNMMHALYVPQWIHEKEKYMYQKFWTTGCTMPFGMQKPY
jgi:hypothetical protein